MTRPARAAAKPAFARLLIAAMAALSALPALGQLRSFGEAEGFGATATGARASPTIVHVTNLNDSGAGSFRDAVSASNRIVVFDVGGVINLNSAISAKGNITIAGQTAPGEGVSINGYELSFAGQSNVICRYLRLRPGDNSPSTDDCLSTYNATNVIVDHVSMEFAKWNNIGGVTDNGGSPQTTFQNCLIADPIGQQFGAHMESIYGNFTFTKNLFANSHNRNPLAKINEQFINNIDYNNEASYTTHTSTPFKHDLVNNAFIWGPAQSGNTFYQLSSGDTFYASGNVQDSDKDGVLDLGAVAPTTGTIVSSPSIAGTLDLPTLSVPDAYAYVVAQAGCSLDRDELDNLVISQVQTLGNGTAGKGVGTAGPSGGLYGSASSTGLSNGGLGTTVGGTRPSGFDSDNDGIPNAWESAHGLNPNVADSLLFNPLGYRMIEQYVNELGDQNVTRTYSATGGAFATASSWAGGVLPGVLDKGSLVGTGTADGAATVSSGTSTLLALAVGGNGPAAGERLTVSGGKLDVYDTLTVGASNNALVTVTGGTLEAYNVVLGATAYPASTSTSGTIDLKGGTLGVSSLVNGAGGPSNWTSGGQLNMTGGLIRAIGDLSVTVPILVNGTGGMIDTNGRSGTVSGMVSGSGGLTKIGSGILAVSGSNAMQGGIRVNSGTVAINHLSAAGTGSLILGGGNVSFGSVSGITTPVTMLTSGTLVAGGITLNGSVSGSSQHRLGIATTTTGNLTLAGTLGLAGTLDLGPSTGNVRLNAAAANGSSIATFDLGASTASLRTAYTATVQMGSLLGGTATKLQGSTNDSGLVTYVIGSTGQSTTFNGTVTDGIYATPGPVGLTKVGAGMLTLASAASTFTGITRISGGTLSATTLGNGGAASSIGASSADASNLVLDGGTLQYTGSAVTTDRAFTLTGSGGTLERHGTGNLVFGGTGAIVMAGAGSRTLTLSGSSTAFNNLAAAIDDPSSGKTSLVKSGPGTWRLAGNSKTYSGDTVVSGGSLYLLAASILPSGTGKGDLSVAAGATLDLYGNSQTINGLNGGGTVTTTLNTARTLTIGSGDASGTFSGTLTQGTAQSLALTKIGAGIQRLTGSSNYAGTTSLRGGTLSLGASGALGTGVVTISGSARRLAISSTAAIGNSIVIDGPTGTAAAGVIHHELAGTGVLSGGTITILTNPLNGGVFGSAAGGELLVASRVVAAPSARVSVGSGTVTLAGGGSYATLDQMAGTLRVGAANGIASNATVTVGSLFPATLDLAGYDQSLVGIVQGAGGGVIGNGSTSRDATLTVTGSCSYGGTLQDSVLGGSRRMNLSVDGGRLWLSAPNAYSGTTTVRGGRLVLDDPASLGTSTLVLLAGGTAAVGQGGLVTAKAIAFGGGLVDLGSGRLDIAAAGLDQGALVTQLLSGRGDGSWDGPTGIASKAVASLLAGGTSRTVGWIANGDGSLSVAATVGGDANLDGVLDILDVMAFIGGSRYDSGDPAVWGDGDFNYDGVVDQLDLADFMGAGLFDQGPVSLGLSSPLVASVPEPSIPASGLLAAVLLTITAVKSSICRAPAAKALVSE